MQGYLYSKDIGPELGKVRGNRASARTKVRQIESYGQAMIVASPKVKVIEYVCFSQMCSTFLYSGEESAPEYRHLVGIGSKMISVIDDLLAVAYCQVKLSILPSQAVV